MAKMGDWRDNKDEELELDGIGGVNILVKADVHRSGALMRSQINRTLELTETCRHKLPVVPLREPGRDRGIRQDGQEGRLQGIWPTQLRRVAHRHGREAPIRTDG